MMPGFFRKLEFFGLICCGCRYRYTKDEAVYYYKNTCICRECFGKLEAVDGEMVFYGEEFNEMTLSPFFYSGMYRDIFKKFKFNGLYAYGHILGMAAAERLKNVKKFESYDCIVPVPLSAERYRDRGYNQSEIMAEHISAMLKIPLEKLLIRVRDSKPNSLSKTVDRLANVKDAYRAADNVKGKRIILFDDIHTTGSTIYECRRTLMEAGAAEVCNVTAAYSYRKEENKIENRHTI